MFVKKSPVSDAAGLEKLFRSSGKLYLLPCFVVKVVIYQA